MLYISDYLYVGDRELPSLLMFSPFVLYIPNYILHPTLLSMIFPLPLFGATFIPNLKFLAMHIVSYGPRAKMNLPPPGLGRVRKSPVLIGLNQENYMQLLSNTKPSL